MNKSQMIALYDQDQRKEVAYPGMRWEVTPNVVRHSDTSDNREGMVISPNNKEKTKFYV